MLNGVTYGAINGVNMWVAVGNNIVYSPDGIDWYLNSYQVNLQSIVYNPTDSSWLLLGANTGDYNNSILYTTDPTGTTFQGPEIGGFDTQGNYAAWNGSNWVAVGKDSNGNTIQYSTDGLNWYPATNFTTSENFPNFTGIGVAYGNNIWITVGKTSSGNPLYYSTDGTVFTPIPYTRYNFFYDIQYLYGSTWVATQSNSANSNTSNFLISSNNGLAWSPVALQQVPVKPLNDPLYRINVFKTSQIVTSNLVITSNWQMNSNINVYSNYNVDSNFVVSCNFALFSNTNYTQNITLTCNTIVNCNINIYTNTILFSNYVTQYTYLPNSNITMYNTYTRTSNYVVNSNYLYLSTITYNSYYVLSNAYSNYFGIFDSNLSVTSTLTGIPKSNFVSSNIGPTIITSNYVQNTNPLLSNTIVNIVTTQSIVQIPVLTSNIVFVETYSPPYVVSIVGGSNVGITQVTIDSELSNFTFNTTSQLNLYDIWYNGSLWVAVGSSPSICYSSNGSNWFAPSTTFSTQGNGVTYGYNSAVGSNIWVAVGSDSSSNNIYYSYNGTNWSQNTNIRTNSLTSVVYNVYRNDWLITSTSSNSILYTIDPTGSNFKTNVQGGFTTANYIAQSNALSVAVGSQSNNYNIQYSTNGSNWFYASNISTNSRQFFTISGSGVAYGNGYWIAVGDSSNIYSSINGSNYSQLSTTYSNYIDIQYFNNSTWLASAIDSNQRNVYLTSYNNCSNWSAFPTVSGRINVYTPIFLSTQIVVTSNIILTSNIQLTTSNILSSNIYIGTQFASNYTITFASDNPTNGIYSYNIKSNSITSNNNSNSEKCVWYNGSLYVAVGSNIQYSTNGKNWSNSTNYFTTPLALNGVTYGAINGVNMWVAVGNNIVYSPDGLNWYLNNYPVNLQSIIYNPTNSSWLLLGSNTNFSNNNSILYTTDPTGTNFQGPVQGGFSIQGNYAAWNGSIWVAVGYDSSYNIQYSSDGSNWYFASNITLSSTTFFGGYGTGIAYGNNIWLAVGDDRGVSSTIYSSTDGSNFTRKDTSHDGLVDVQYVYGSTWVATVNNHYTSPYFIISSNNGYPWIATALNYSPNRINVFTTPQIVTSNIVVTTRVNQINNVQVYSNYNVSSNYIITSNTVITSNLTPIPTSNVYGLTQDSFQTSNPLISIDNLATTFSIAAGTLIPTLFSQTNLQVSGTLEGNFLKFKQQDTTLNTIYSSNNALYVNSKIINPIGGYIEFIYSAGATTYPLYVGSLSNLANGWWGTYNSPFVNGFIVQPGYVLTVWDSPSYTGNVLFSYSNTSNFPLYSNVYNSTNNYLSGSYVLRTIN